MSELLQEAQVVRVEVTDVINAVAKQRDALYSQAKCEAGVAVGIIAGIGDDLGMDHARAENLDPAGTAARAAALAPANEAVNPQFIPGSTNGK